MSRSHTHKDMRYFSYLHGILSWEHNANSPYDDEAYGPSQAGLYHAHVHALVDADIHAYHRYLLGLQESVWSPSAADTAHHAEDPDHYVQRTHTEAIAAKVAEHKERYCHEIHVVGRDGMLRAEIYTEDICDIQRRTIVGITPSEDEMNELQMCARTQYSTYAYCFAEQPARTEAAIDAIVADMDKFTRYCQDFILEESVVEIAANDIQRCLENRDTLVHLVLPKACECTPEHESLVELIERDCAANHTRLITILGRDNRKDDDSDDDGNDADDHDNDDYDDDDAQDTIEIDFYKSLGYRLLPWRHNIRGYVTIPKELNVYSKHLDGDLFDLDMPYYRDM